MMTTTIIMTTTTTPPAVPVATSGWNELFTHFLLVAAGTTGAAAGPVRAATSAVAHLWTAETVTLRGAATATAWMYSSSSRQQIVSERVDYWLVRKQPHYFTLLIMLTVGGACARWAIVRQFNEHSARYTGWVGMCAERVVDNMDHRLQPGAGVAAEQAVPADPSRARCCKLLVAWS